MTMKVPATTRAEAAGRLLEVAQKLADLADLPVHGLAHHMAMRKAHQALDDYDEVSWRDRKKEQR